MDKEAARALIPDRLKRYSDYRLFLTWAEESDAKTPAQLRRDLDDQIAFSEKWLRVNGAESKLGTKNRLLRATAKHLDFLKAIKNRYMKYV